MIGLFIRPKQLLLLGVGRLRLLSCVGDRGETCIKRDLLLPTKTCHAPDFWVCDVLSARAVLVAVGGTAASVLS